MKKEIIERCDLPAIQERLAQLATPFRSGISTCMSVKRPPVNPYPIVA
jgi:hypothetical protein